MPAFYPERHPEPLVYQLETVDVLIGEPAAMSVARRRRRINGNDYPTPILTIGRQQVVAREDIQRFLEMKRAAAEADQARRKAASAAAVAGRQAKRAERAARGETEDPGLRVANRVRRAKRETVAEPLS